MLFCCIYVAVFFCIFGILYYQNWHAYANHGDHLVRPFIDSLQTSLSRDYEIPFVWLYPLALEASERSPEIIVHMWLCSAGTLLALTSGIFCLVLVPKGVPGRRTALLSLFGIPILLDCTIGLMDRIGAAYLHAFLSSLLCLVLLGLRTVSLARRRREFAASSRALTVYSVGLLAKALSLVTLFILSLSQLREGFFSGGRWWKSLGLLGN